MQCPICQFENRDEAKLCGKCGCKFEVACTECKQKNHAGNNFYDECGQNLILSLAHTSKELSLDEKLDKIQRYLPTGLTDKILSRRNKIEGERRQGHEI